MNKIKLMTLINNSFKKQTAPIGIIERDKFKYAEYKRLETIEEEKKKGVELGIKIYLLLKNGGSVELIAKKYNLPTEEVQNFKDLLP